MHFPEVQRRAILIAIAVIGIVVWAGLTLGRRPEDPFEQIVRASNAMQHRVLQSRLAGPFDYRPLISTQRGAADKHGTDDVNARLALMNVSLRIAARQRSTRDLHALGASYLLLGETERAIRAFEGALQKDAGEHDLPSAIRRSRNAALLNDLAAAYQDRANRTQTAFDRVAVLEVAQRAWTLSKTPEAAWNRALALEQLFVRDAVRSAWNDYLTRDGSSPWSIEARTRLAAWQEPTLTDRWKGVEPRFDAIVAAGKGGELDKLVAEFPQQVRIHAEDVMLARWANDTSDAGLRSLRVVGEALVAHHNERIVIAIVDAIERAEPARRRRIIEGYRQYASAKHLYETSRVVEAAEGLERASLVFEINGIPVLASLAGLFQSAALFTTEHYDSAFELADKALAGLDEPDCYPSLVARLEWMRGLCHLALGRPWEAVHSYDRALAAVERAGEQDFAGALSNLRGEAREAIGDAEGGLESRLAALRIKNAVGGRTKYEQILAGVARALFLQRRLDGALQLVDVAVAHPQFGDRADFASEVLLLRGVILRELGRHAAAAAALADARRYADQSGEQIRAAALADIDVLLALNTSSDETPHGRVERLTTALAHARRTGNHYHEPRLLLQRARALREAGDAAAAIADLRAGLASVELQRRTIPQRETRAMYFASARELVTELADVLLDAGRVEDAFDVAESGRARALLDPADDQERQLGLTHDRIIGELRRGETLVSNLALKDRLVTWIVSGRGIRVTHTAIGRDALERLLVQHNSGDRASDPAVYDAIMAPVDADPLMRVVFVPDPVLPPVSLAVLRDGRGAYLIEKYPIVYDSSATAYVRSTRAGSSSRRSSSPRVFAAAASYFDPTLFAGLDPLAAAESEVAQVVAIYAGAAVRLSGRALTAARFLEAAKNADIVHIAGHAVGGGLAHGAALVMAPDLDRGSAGLLYARTIGQQVFTRSRLVVLATCGVTSRADVDSKAIGSIAYAFLAAGVPAVISTAHPVDDQIAAEFSPRLHAALAEKRDAAVALQAAQLSYIHSNDPAMREPVHWAAFRLYGHYED